MFGIARCFCCGNASVKVSSTNLRIVAIDNAVSYVETNAVPFVFRIFQILNYGCCCFLLRVNEQLSFFGIENVAAR